MEYFFILVASMSCILSVPSEALIYWSYNLLMFVSFVGDHI